MKLEDIKRWAGQFQGMYYLLISLDKLVVFMITQMNAIINEHQSLVLSSFLT